MSFLWVGGNGGTCPMHSVWGGMCAGRFSLFCTSLIGVVARGKILFFLLYNRSRLWVEEIKHLLRTFLSLSWWCCPPKHLFQALQHHSHVHCTGLQCSLIHLNGSWLAGSTGHEVFIFALHVHSSLQLPLQLRGAVKMHLNHKFSLPPNGKCKQGLRAHSHGQRRKGKSRRLSRSFITPWLPT